MFLTFYDALRRHGVPVSLREFLDFLSLVATGLATYDIDAFYHLARTSMVKSETRLDRFDLTRTPNFEPRRGPALPTVTGRVRWTDPSFFGYPW